MRDAYPLGDTQKGILAAMELTRDYAVKDLAALTGSGSDTVSRALASLKKRGKVRRSAASGRWRRID